MNIKVIAENQNEENLVLRIKTGIMSYINWMNIRWYKSDLKVDDLDTEYYGIMVIGDPKYEKKILQIIEEAKNGAYEMM